MVISERTHYTMEEVTRRTGMTPRTLRYYEEMGLLDPTERTEGGHRLYREADLERLEHIKELKELLGYSLTETRAGLRTMNLLQSLRTRYVHATDPSARLAVIEEAQPLLEGQLAAMGSRLARLQQLYERGQARACELADERDQLRARIQKER